MIIGSNPDPTFHFDANPDPGPSPNFTHVGKFNFFAFIHKAAPVYIVVSFSSVIHRCHNFQYTFLDSILKLSRKSEVFLYIWLKWTQILLHNAVWQYYSFLSEPVKTFLKWVKKPIEEVKGLRILVLLFTSKLTRITFHFCDIAIKKFVRQICQNMMELFNNLESLERVRINISKWLVQ